MPPNIISDEELNTIPTISDEELNNIPEIVENPPAQEASTDWSLSALASSVPLGLLKGIPQVVTRPADLLMRGALEGREALGFEPLDPKSVESFMPTNIWKESVDTIAGENYPKNKYVEGGSEILGNVAGMVNTLPSALPKAMAATEGMSLIPRALEVGTRVAPEGAAYGAMFGAADMDKPLIRSAAEGMTTNFMAGAASPVIQKVAQSASSALNNTSDRLTEKSIGAGVKDFAAVRRQSGMDVNDSGALETKLNDAIRWTRDAGIFPAFRSPAKTVSSVANHKELYGQQIGSIMQELDTIGPAKGIIPKLSLNKTNELLAKAQRDPVIAEDVAAQVGSFKDLLSRNWDGSANGLFQAKKSLGKMTWNKGGQSFPVDKQITAALYSDITDTLQRTAQDAIDAGVMAPEKLNQLLQANKAFSNLSLVQDVVDPAALALQQQRIAPWKKVAWTTGGYGLPMAAGYQAAGIPGAIAVGAAGLLSQSRVGQAAGSWVARNGANALEQIANNPYIAQGVSLALMPRDWDRVKKDESALEAIGLRLGMSVQDFVSLPEPIQKQIHSEIISSDPSMAEPVPGNLSIANGKFLNPAEKDFHVQDSLDKPASERAKIIGSSFENKYVPSTEAIPSFQNEEPLEVDIERFNNAIDVTDYSYDNSTGSMLDEMDRAIQIHSENQ